MEPTRRTRLTATLILAVLVGSPGVLFAGCAAACPFGKAAAGRPCCRPHGAAPAVRSASCCETVRTVPAQAPRAAVPPAAVAFIPAVPVELPGAPVAEPIAEQSPNPPPLFQGIGLYTLHAAFLI
jgi:hypothetical protein